MFSYANEILGSLVELEAPQAGGRAPAAGAGLAPQHQKGCVL